MDRCRQLEEQYSFDGEPLTPSLAEHISGCEECGAIWEAHQRLERQLADAGESYRLRSDAHDRLWKAIESAEGGAQPPDASPSANAPRSRRTFRFAAMATAALAAAAAVAVALLPPSKQPDIAFRVVASDSAVRAASDYAVGDRLEVDVDATPHVSARVYRDRQTLLAACPGTKGCQRSGSRLRLHITLSSPGLYEIVILRGSAPLPAPAGSSDGDVSGASRAGAEYELIEIDVR